MQIKFIIVVVLFFIEQHAIWPWQVSIYCYLKLEFLFPDESDSFTVSVFHFTSWTRNQSFSGDEPVIDLPRQYHDDHIQTII